MLPPPHFFFLRFCAAVVANLGLRNHLVFAGFFFISTPITKPTQPRTPLLLFSHLFKPPPGSFPSPPPPRMSFTFLTSCLSPGAPHFGPLNPFLLGLVQTRCELLIGFPIPCFVLPPCWDPSLVSAFVHAQLNLVPRAVCTFPMVPSHVFLRNHPPRPPPLHFYRPLCGLGGAMSDSDI